MNEYTIFKEKCLHVLNLSEFLNLIVFSEDIVLKSYKFVYATLETSNFGTRPANMFFI